MTSTFIALTIVLGLALLALLAVAIRRHFKSETLDELEGRLAPVDVSALANLLQPREDIFLRQNLGPKEYKFIKRRRILAAQEYLSRISRNASILSKIALLALDSPDPQIHETALNLSKDAVEVRQYAVLMRVRLTVQWLYPEMETASFKVRERYAALTEHASWLYRLQFPENSTRIAVALCG